MTSVFLIFLMQLAPKTFLEFKKLSHLICLLLIHSITIHS